MTYKMSHIEPLELKILITSIAGAMVSPVDAFVKFIIPIASGIAWVFLKPFVLRFRDYLKNRFRK